MFPFLESQGRPSVPVSWNIATSLTWPPLFFSLPFCVHSPHYLTLSPSLVMLLPIQSQLLLFSPVFKAFYNPFSFTYLFPPNPSTHPLFLLVCLKFPVVLNSPTACQQCHSPAHGGLAGGAGRSCLSWLSPKSLAPSLSTCVLAHAVSLIAWWTLLIFPSPVQMHHLCNFLLVAWQKSTDLSLYSLQWSVHSSATTLIRSSCCISIGCSHLFPYLN